MVDDTANSDTGGNDPLQDALFADAPVPVAPAAVLSEVYRVLARKYRPTRFEDLIGQEPMVRTLRNAFAIGRIPQAWMLTGVRGVGKTTTARILARALNYELSDGDAQASGPTVTLDRIGVHCQAIMESRHVDVMEMDAASHTSIDDVRQIVDGVRYAPVSARMKVYIIDEVHMLSEKAFNAFLKTLEEPPPHAKFVFATTDIRKVPVTILSRCQRFDLRRVESDALIAHLANICRIENVAVEDEALALIARASEGSVRDALSLLDQAIAHARGSVQAATVRDMLGLADRALILDLFETLMKGDIADALIRLRALYDVGADPATTITDLAQAAHLVTRLKILPSSENDRSLSEDERVRGGQFARNLSTPALSRAWQVLTKGLPEVETAARPIQAAEMLLVRLAYSATLPTPEEALKALESGPGVPPTTTMPALPSAASQTSPPQASASQTSPPQASSPQASPSQASARLGPASDRLAAADGSQSRAALRLQTLPEVAAPPSAPEAILIGSLAELAALAREKREIRFALALERHVSIVRFERGRIEFVPVEMAPRDLAGDIAKWATEWSGERWMVVVASEPGQPTLAQARLMAAQDGRARALQEPIVQAVLALFPGATIVPPALSAAGSQTIATTAIEESERGETDFSDFDIGVFDSED